MSQRYIKKHLTKSWKSKKCTNSIAKECNNLKNVKPQDLPEECSLPTISLQHKEIFLHILMNVYLNKIRAQNSTNRKIFHIDLKTLSKKIYLVKFFLTKKRKIVKFKLTLLVVLKWDKVAYYQAKIFLISETLPSFLIFYKFFVFFIPLFDFLGLVLLANLFMP